MLEKRNRRDFDAGLYTWTSISKIGAELDGSSRCGVLKLRRASVPLK